MNTSNEEHDDAASAADFPARLLAAKQGDENAAEWVLRDAHRELAAYVRSIVRGGQGPFDPSDLMQTVLSEAWVKIACCQGETRPVFLAWLKKIAQSRHLDAVKFWGTESRGGKAKHVEPKRNGDAGWLFLVDDVTNGQAGPATALEKQELLDAMKKAMDSLPTAYRDTITLFYFGGLNSQQVSQKLNISQGTVLVRLSRARDMLRSALLRAMGTSILS